MCGIVIGNRGSLLSRLCSGAKFGVTDESAVKALLESAKLRLYDAFLAQMAHWSSDRLHYGLFVPVGTGESLV